MVKKHSKIKSSDPTRQVLQLVLQEASNPSLSVALTYWTSGLDEPPQPAPSSFLYRVLLETAADIHARARLLAACAKEPGAWVQALPLGLHINNEVVRVGMCPRLGATLCHSHPHLYQHCQVQVDHQGLHGLSCRKGQGSHPCRAAINDITSTSLTSADMRSHLEPTGICFSNGK